MKEENKRDNYKALHFVKMRSWPEDGENREYNKKVETFTETATRFHLTDGSTVVLVGRSMPDEDTKYICGYDIYGKTVFVHMDNVTSFEEVDVVRTRWDVSDDYGFTEAYFLTYVLDKNTVVTYSETEYHLPDITAVYEVLTDGTLSPSRCTTKD